MELIFMLAISVATLLPNQIPDAIKQCDAMNGQAVIELGMALVYDGHSNPAIVVKCVREVPVKPNA